jgi:hypothetical protein
MVWRKRIVSLSLQSIFLQNLQKLKACKIVLTWDPVFLLSYRIRLNTTKENSKRLRKTNKVCEENNVWSRLLINFLKKEKQKESSAIQDLEGVGLDVDIELTTPTPPTTFNESIKRISRFMDIYDLFPTVRFSWRFLIRFYSESFS